MWVLYGAFSLFMIWRQLLSKDIWSLIFDSDHRVLEEPHLLLKFAFGKSNTPPLSAFVDILLLL